MTWTATLSLNTISKRRPCAQQYEGAGGGAAVGGHQDTANANDAGPMKVVRKAYPPLRKCRLCHIWPATQGTICGHCFGLKLAKLEARARKAKGIVYGFA